MKKLISFAAVILILGGCRSTAAIEKLDQIPQDLVEHIQSTEIMTVIEKGERTLYLILMSDRDVAEAAVETDEELLVVRVEESGEEREGKEPMLFRITRNPEHDTLDVYLNGEPAILTSRIIGDDK